MSDDRYKYFRVEAREILEQLGQCALDLEKETSVADAVGRLLRLAHTLKGAARVVKQQAIADCAHGLEEVLAPFRETRSPVPREIIDGVLALVDDIGHGVALLSPAPPSPARDRVADEPVDPLPSFRPEVDDLDALLRGVLEARMRLGALASSLAQVGRARQLAAALAEQRGRSGKDAGHAGAPARTAKTVEAAEELRGIVKDVERDLASSVDQLDRELRQVREAAERLRLAPVAGLFTYLERAVRDVAAAQGKRIVFEAFGGDVRVDSFVLNILQGALLHVVRNAAAHGIEDGGQRQAAGKPIAGRVTLRVSQQGRLVSVSCTDDGRGVDLEAVRRVAQRKGIIVEGGSAADPQALFDVLLRGGISTSSHVTDVSGRGIGLDVVREAAERLGGSVTARTDRGAGTTITLTVPLSVASFDALMVDAAGTRFAIPLDRVRGALRLTPGDIIRSEHSERVIFDGGAVPLISLKHLVLPSAEGVTAADRATAVVVGGTGRTAAIAVDRVAETLPIVMRPLPDLAPADPLVAGATLDDVGDPLLILDPDHLVAGAQRPGSATFESAPARKPVLVIDDSLTTRMLEQSILESAGFAVDVAPSAEDALDKVRATRYALFLVDVEMPGMDGFTFIETIRADPALRDIPAVLVTSRDAPEDRRRGREVGAQGYVVKSEFDQGQLLDHLRRLIA